MRISYMHTTKYQCIQLIFRFHFDSNTISQEDNTCSATLTINNDLPLTSTLQTSRFAPAQNGGVASLFIGGLPANQNADPRAEPFTNFIGCVRDLQVCDFGCMFICE